MLKETSVVLDEIIETFLNALGPFGDPAVATLARSLHDTLATQPDQLRVLMQAHRRVGVRDLPVLVAIVGDDLVVSAPGGDAHRWSRTECSVTVRRLPLAGTRLAVRTSAGSVVLSQAMPVDEGPRLIWALTEAGSGSGDPRFNHGVAAYSRHPPVARLGAAATLYDDRISFTGAPTRALSPGVMARALELPAGGAAVLGSVSRLMRGARGKPRHVLIDGPGWSQVAPAPESAPDLADGFAAAVNRWANP